jgi:methanogen homocitrate synthase
MEKDFLKMDTFPDFPLRAPYYIPGKIWTSKHNWDLEDKTNKPESVIIHDVTLRDGDQTPGVVLKEDERVRIADALAEMQIPRIEAGMPVATKMVEKAMRTMVSRNYEHSKIYSFVRAIPSDVELSLDIGVHGIIIEYTVNPYIIKYAYKNSPQELVDKLVTALNMAKVAGLDVVFMGWDWFRSPIEFTKWLVGELYVKTEMDGLAIVDTYGTSTPDVVGKMISLFKNWYPRLRLEFHGHNDIGCGNANCLAAIYNGAEVVHTAMNGLGERCGNVATEEVAITCEIHKGINTGLKLNKIFPTAKLVSAISKIPISDNKPIIGSRPYQLESGISIDIAYKLKHNENAPIEGFCSTVDSSVIGREGGVEYVLGKSSGRSTIKLFLEKYNIMASNEEIDEILEMVVAEASVTKGLVSEESFLQIASKIIGANKE